MQYGDFTSAGGAAAAARLLDTHPDIDGICVASDLMAVGALGVLASRLPRPAERSVGGLRQF